MTSPCHKLKCPLPSHSISVSGSSGPARKLQRINSQEELDFHETSSGSDQSELYRTDSMGELELDNPRGTAQDRTFVRLVKW